MSREEYTPNKNFDGKTLSNIIDSFAKDLIIKKLITGKLVVHTSTGTFVADVKSEESNRNKNEVKVYEKLAEHFWNNKDVVPFSEIGNFDMFLPKRKLNEKEMYDWSCIYIKYLGYFRINQNILNKIKSFTGSAYIQEVDAGNCLLTHLLYHQNIKMRRPKDKITVMNKLMTLTAYGYYYGLDIEKKSSLDTIEEIDTNDILLISWIYPNNEDSIPLLKKYKNPKLIIFAEINWTATKEFYILLEELFDVEKIKYDPFTSTNQEVYFCIRK